MLVWMPVQPYASSSVMQRVLELAEPGAAVLGGHRRVHEADLPGLLEDVHRELGLAIALGGDRDDALLREAAGLSMSAFCSSVSEKSSMTLRLLYVCRTPPRRGGGGM